jgi:hypothetical protein
MTAKEMLEMSECAASRLLRGQPIDDDWYKGHGLHPLHIKDAERDRFHAFLGGVVRTALNGTPRIRLIDLDLKAKGKR